MQRMRIRYLVAGIAAVLVTVMIALVGSGELGPVQPGWSVEEMCTPDAPGDTTGSVGSSSLAAGSTSTSRYVTDNEFALTNDESGTWRGRVTAVTEEGLDARVGAIGGLGFLVANRTMPPVWAQDTNTVKFLTYGSGTGQTATPNDIAVDPVDGTIFVASYGTVDGVDRYRIIKFDTAGEYVTEFGSFGTGNGQFGGPISVAVSPVDQAVWVGDHSNSRIQKFTRTNATTYTYSTKVGSSGSGNGQFGTGGSPGIPVAVDSSGNVYAGDRGNSRIQKFNSSATYVTQSDPLPGDVSPYDVKVDGALVYASIGLVIGGQETPGRINQFTTNLVPFISADLDLSALIFPAPAGTTTGIGYFDVRNGAIWPVWFGATYIPKYYNHTETSRWQSLFPAPVDLNSTMAIALSGDDMGYVLFRYTGDRPGVDAGPYGDMFVTGFDLRPVPLSDAIETYMRACDPTLNGYTYDYQAATDPDVVFPGWSGDVWARLKELCTAYNIELALVDDVIVVRDVGAVSLPIESHTPVRLQPTSSPSGRHVQIVAQQPSAGGGLMWDAATEAQTFSIDAGKRVTVTLATDNHPVRLGVPTPTDTLPIHPGQYYVVDSTGTHVPVEMWTSEGGEIRAAVGDSPGTIEVEFIGPTSTITGFTGPFSFATGKGPTATGAFSIVGNGVVTDRTIVKIPTGANPAATTTEVAATIDSPFIDTKTRAYDRGAWTAAEAAGPNVEISFAVPISDLPGYGLTAGAVVTHEGSMYRVREVSWGNLVAAIVASRRVTAGDVVTAWAGQTAGDYDTFWDGYTAGDQRIQPILTER